MSVTLGEGPFDTALGQVRLLISDVDADNLMLSDTQVGGFLRLHGGVATDTACPVWVLRRAAADALDAIATSEALVSKVMRTQAGVVTDGAKLADSLRRQAAAWRVMADDAEADADDDGGIAFLEFSPYPAGW